MSTAVFSPPKRNYGFKEITEGQRVLFAFLLSVAICILRRPDIFTVPQFFVEDGSIFYNQQLVLGTAHSLFKSYAGYLLLIPRLLAAVSCLAPIRMVPTMFAILSVCVIGAIGSLFSLNCYRYLIRSDLLRVAFPVLLFSVTDSSPFIGNLTNLIWYLTPLALMILLAPKASLDNVSAVWAIAIGFLMISLALSQPLCVILLPLIAWRLVTVAGLSRIIPGALFLGIIIQVVYFRLASGTSGISLPTTHLVKAILAAIGTKVLLVIFAGARSTELMDCQTKIKVLSILLVLSIASAIVLWRNRATGPLFLLGSAYLLVMSVAVPIRGRLGNLAPVSICTPGDWGGPRYYLFGSFVIIFLLVVFVDHLNTKSVISLLALSSVALPAFTYNFPLPYSQYNSHWRRYVPAIREWKSAKRNCQPTFETVIPTGSSGWYVDLPALANCKTGKVLPDRYIVTTDQKQFYLVDRGQKRLIPDRHTIDELRVSRIETITRRTLLSMPTGRNVPLLVSYAVQNAATGEVDFIDHGRRRYVPDPKFLVNLGPADPLQPLPNDQFVSFTLGLPVKSPFPIQTHQLSVLKNKDGVLYLVEDGIKHRVPDLQTVDALGMMSDIKLASNSELNSLLTSYELPHVPGRVLQNSGTGAVFLLDRGRLRHIPDPETLETMNLGNQIHGVPDSVAEAIPTGPPLPHLSRSQVSH